MLSKSRSETKPVAWILTPIMAVVFIGFLIIGMAMPVLPLHVHDDLGLGTLVVGVVAGSQFFASLFTRIWAGDYSDRRGPKQAVVVGLAAAAVAGALYVSSLIFIERPPVSALILAVGRGVLGGAESLIITGAVAWGLALAGPQHSGKVIAWVGTAMFGAFAIGAPIGTGLFSSMGFVSIAIATTGLPLLTFLIVLPMSSIPGRASTSGSRREVIGAVWLPGLGAALSSVGYGAIITFSILLFVDRHWTNGWLAVTSFAAALVISRILVGHLADKIGGAVTALAFVFVEALGLVILWLAPWFSLGLLGAAIVGVGYSLVYPGFGVEVVRAAPPENRGLAMGLYAACLDLALAASGPLLGFIGNVAGLAAIFLASALAVLCAAPVALWIIGRTRKLAANNLAA